MKKLVEDGFESGFYDWNGIPELTIPNDWGADWDEGSYSRFEADQKFKTPEVRTGNSSLSIQTTDGHKHRGVIFRQFEAEPGKLHRASIWAMGLTHTKGDSGHGMRIGIDPTGRLDYRADTVVWGDWYDQYHKDDSDQVPWVDGKWVRLPRVARAENDRITVFVYTGCDWAKGAMAHFDDFLLEVEGDEGEQPPPPPQPGDDSAIVAQLKRIADALELLPDRLGYPAPHRTA